MIIVSPGDVGTLTTTVARGPRLAWIAVLIVFTLITIAATQRAAAGLSIGVNALWTPGDVESLRARFRKAKALGLQQVRMDFEWRQAESERGTLRWGRLDDLVRTAQEEGVELLPIVHYAPDWAVRPERKRSGIYEMSPREDTFPDYARFLQASIERYGPDGNAPFPLSTPLRYWQVWNEPNMASFWGPAPDAAAFTRLMRKVHEATAPSRTRVRLVHAGLSKSDLIFVWQLWEADPHYGDTFDIMAVHPYLFHHREGVRKSDAMDEDVPEYAKLGFVGSATDPGYLGKVFNLRLFMELRGVRNKPIWITEMGYLAGSHILALKEDDEARALGETIEFIRRRLTDGAFGTGARALPVGVERVYWFALEDYPESGGLGQFGLYREDGSVRPMAHRLKTLLP